MQMHENAQNWKITAKENRMKFKITKQDLLLASRRMSYASAASLPLSFKLGDRLIHGIPDDFAPKTEQKFIDSNIVETVITGTNAAGLTIRAEILEYRDFPTVEYTVYFTNNGKEDTEVLSEIRAIDADFCGSDPVLHHGTGDNCGIDGYLWFDDAITGEGITINPVDDGTSCNGAYPFFRVIFEDYVLTGAVGWTGTWMASFRKNEMGINLIAGQKYCNFKILPGETMRTPRMCLMITDTNSQLRSMNIWRHFYNKHIMPKQWGQNIPPKACMHVFNYKAPEFTGATEDSQIYGLNQYIKKGTKPDLWWFDAGFYKCDGDWPKIGTWKEDTTRFPNGLAPVGEECAKNNIDLMVWFEPERVTAGSEIETEHPEFLLRAKNDDGNYDYNSLFNLGDPKALAWMIDRIDTLIKKWHITCYRQDFNFAPFRYWRQNEAEDRLGALENLSIQGYYKYWDTLLLRNPGLFLDSCASGGRRNDLETLRRSVPFQYTDFGLGDHKIKQKQHQQLFQWAPYFRAHTFAWDNNNIVDDVAFFNAFAPAVTYTANVWDDESQFEVGRKMLPIWRRAAELELTGEFYPQMESTRSDKDFYCVHFYDQDKKEGFVLFIRNRECEQESFTAKLALCPKCEYIVENPLTGETYVKSGAELQEFTQSLDQRQGAVWFFKKVVK